MNRPPIAQGKAHRKYGQITMPAYTCDTCGAWDPDGGGSAPPPDPDLVLPGSSGGGAGSRGAA